MCGKNRAMASYPNLEAKDNLSFEIGREKSYISVVPEVRASNHEFP